MGKFKGILKKTSGELKKGYFWISTAGMLISFVGCMTSVIGMAVNDKHLDEDYRASSLYQDYVHEQKVDLETAYNNGDLTFGEYMKKLDVVEEEIDLEELINRDVEGNEEYQARLKSVDKWTTATIALAAVTGVGMGVMISYIPLCDKLDASAKKDLLEAEQEFNNVKAGASPKPKKTKQKPQKEKVPVYVEIEVSGDEDLKSIDEYYNE